MFGFYQTYFICLYSQAYMKISCTKCVTSGKLLRSLTYTGSERLVQHSLQACASATQDLYTHGRGRGEEGVLGTGSGPKRATSFQTVNTPPEDLRPCLSTDALVRPVPAAHPRRYRVTPALASLSLTSLLSPCRLASSMSWIFPFKMHQRVISHLLPSLCELQSGADCLATVVPLTLSTEL